MVASSLVGRLVEATLQAVASGDLPCDHASVPQGRPAEGRRGGRGRRTGTSAGAVSGERHPASVCTLATTALAPPPWGGRVGLR